MAASSSGPDDGSIARELYPVALKQARFEAVMHVATWLGWGAFWAASARNGLMGICGGALLMSGIAPTVRAFKWWRWLKHATPEQALPRLLP